MGAISVVEYITFDEIDVNKLIKSSEKQSRQIEQILILVKYVVMRNALKTLWHKRTNEDSLNDMNTLVYIVKVE